MTSTLVLFCGGPAIYGGVPKPLQRLRTGQTLIEHYLHFVKVGLHRQIILLVDKAFERDFSVLLEAYNSTHKLILLACPDNSSTFDKLKFFLDSSSASDQSLMFSYPDIFVDGEINEPINSDILLSDKALISYIPVVSRFPRLVIDAYDDSVRGISFHSSPVPANPLHVFGGHLLVRQSLMTSFVNIFLAETNLSSPSLEFDLFFWLINTLRMHSMPIHGRWIQADSPRDLESILALT